MFYKIRNYIKFIYVVFAINLWVKGENNPSAIPLRACLKNAYTPRGGQFCFITTVIVFVLNHCRFVWHTEKKTRPRICIFADYSFINVPDVPPELHKDKSWKGERKKKRRDKKKNERNENESGRSFSDPDFRFAIITIR